jgi:DNA-directed RNA polymerase subunit beta
MPAARATSCSSTASEVDYIDVSPKQLVSVAASLVPFLEHDDANRALMGANMQRQSVPLLVAEAPFVGTGMEGVTARDSGAVILAKRNGIVDSVDSERIIVRVEGEHHPTQLSREVGSDIYQLTKFKRSNQNTCINQKPIVRKGERVIKGRSSPTVLAPSRASWLSAATCWWPSCRGAVTTSKTRSSSRKAGPRGLLHLDPHRGVRDRSARHQAGTGRDHARYSQRLRARLRDLDESGIIRIGARSSTGDILVGKVTPKGETQLTPEEKLLRAIFGEKAGDVATLR